MQSSSLVDAPITQSKEKKHTDTQWFLYFLLPLTITLLLAHFIHYLETPWFKFVQVHDEPLVIAGVRFVLSTLWLSIIIFVFRLISAVDSFCKYQRFLCYVSIVTMAFFINVLMFHVGDKSNLKFAQNTLYGEEEDSQPLFQEVAACTRDLSKCEHNALLVTSGIDIGLNHKLTDYLNDNPHIETLCFNSPGGKISEAEEIIQTIQDNSLNTCIADSYYLSDGSLVHYRMSMNYCASACPIITLAGARRIELGTANLIKIHKSGKRRDMGFAVLDYNSNAFDGVQKFYDGEEDKLELLRRTEYAPHWETYELEEADRTLLFNERHPSTTSM